MIMAKVKRSIIEATGTIGDRVHYTRFGKTFSRSRPTPLNDQKSEAQLLQRALFKAMQHTASLLGSAIQRGLAKKAHRNGYVENNEFVSINKHCFSYENGEVHIEYPQLVISAGSISIVEILQCHSENFHVSLTFNPCLSSPHARPDDVVHVYAVEYQIETCDLVASVERQVGQISFKLPDLSEEAGGAITSYLYAMVETSSTATIPTLSPYEKKIDKTHRNINRRVSPSIFIGTIVVQ